MTFLSINHQKPKAMKTEVIYESGLEIPSDAIVENPTTEKKLEIFGFCYVISDYMASRNTICNYHFYDAESVIRIIARDSKIGSPCLYKVSKITK
jgi:hypothetical protein